jgi:serine/threonine-protein kinase
VYLAAHPTLRKQRFALKVLHGQLAADPRAADRFRREAQLAARLNHPNLVPVVDAGATPDGLTWMVMAYVAGRSLSQVIAEQAPLPTARAGAIVRQLASGLAHMHANGLVHRDVKPSNVMLVEHDGEEVVKLLDFGMARVFADEDLARLTATGTTLGSPTYMAPEQIFDPHVGPEADLYALGVVLHEMLTGRPPFFGKSGDVTRAKVSRDVAPPSTDGLGPLAWALLAPHPEDRVRSAREVVAAVDTVLDGGTPIAPPPVDDAPRSRAPIAAARTIPRRGAAAGRRRTLYIAAVLLGAALVGGLATWMLGRP